MNIKNFWLVSVYAIVSAQATQASKGIFAEVNIGGTSNWFGVRFSPNVINGQDENIKLNKQAFYVGASLGCDLTLKNKFYLGTKFYFLCNTAKGEKEDALQTVVDGVNLSYRYNVSYDYLKAQPLYSYGAAILVGGAITPHVLVYAQCGFEGTNWRIENKFHGNKEEKNTNYTYEYFSDQFFHMSGLNSVGKFTGEMKFEKFYASIVPGVGAKYFFNNGMYVGVECNIAIGIHPEDNNGLGKKSLTDKKERMESSDIGQFRMNSSVVLRYGLSLGCKF